ncbi:MAG TPA: hypothetical protein VEA38_14510 [Terriglobales bacterium]|nr:hypothetical protein [Terriglobales bacterium]
MTDDRATLLARIAELEAERDEWKALFYQEDYEHDVTVARANEIVSRAERWAARWKKAAKVWRHTYDRMLRLEARAEAAEARERALRAAVVEYIHEHGLEHEVDCPEDNTCDCALVQDIEAALAATKESSR